MFALFRNDVYSQTLLLQDYLLSLLSKTVQVKESVNGIIHAVQLIGGASRIMRFDSVTELAKAIENYFIELQQVIPFSEIGDLALFFSAVDLLKGIKDLDDAALVEKIQHRDQEIDKITNAISDLLSINSLEKKSILPLKKNKEELSPHPSLSLLEPLAEFEMLALPAMLELFKVELENQIKVLTNGIVSIERGENIHENLKSLMRAAHSIKGAARVVQLAPIIQLAHVMEDLFVLAQSKRVILIHSHTNILLKVIDLLANLARVSPSLISSWIDQEKKYINELIADITLIVTLSSTQPVEKKDQNAEKALEPLYPIKNEKKEEIGYKRLQERVLRVSAQSLSRLMNLAGESLVESRRLFPFNDSMLRLKKKFNELTDLIDILKRSLQEKKLNEIETNCLGLLDQKGYECKQIFNKRLVELSTYISRHSVLTDNLYHEVIKSRMRPFEDCVEAFPRMVRDLAQQFNKKVHFEIIGKSTQVDRDILEKLEAPLAHLLRNAVDHGIELPEKRIALGKAPEGLVRLEAQHRGGMLAISVVDDGRGIDIEEIRRKIVEKKLIMPKAAAKLTETELIDYLFLSGFSTTLQVTEISGRGIGLNVVQNMIQEVAGTIRVSFSAGQGVSFNLLLPLTLSVIQALIVEISNETYAFPLASIDHVMLVPEEKVETIEGKRYFNFEGENIGLFWAWQILEVEKTKISSPLISVIIVNNRKTAYGIVVDKFLYERELVLQELDSRLGKIADISSGTIMEDGLPVFIIDVDYMMSSIDKILSSK